VVHSLFLKLGKSGVVGASGYGPEE